MLGGKRGLLSIALGGLLAAGTVGAVAGCGGDDDSAAKDRVTYSEANEPPEVFIKRMAKLLETTTVAKDCAQLSEINSRSLTRFECPTEKDLRRSMKSFKLVGAEEYGTGAVVDYRSGTAKDGAAVLLYAAPDRTWGVSRFGLLTKPSIETSDEDDREGYDQAVADYLEAVRTRDCDSFVKLTLDTTGASKSKICKTLFPGTEELAKRLKANPSAEPSYEGGNGTYGFYTLETSKPEPENSTISVIEAQTGSAPYVILDVAPSPTAAEQRRVREQLRQQRKERKENGPSMQPDPSKKPSDGPASAA